MKINIEQIYTIEVNGLKVKLTHEQARELYTELSKTFGDRITFSPNTGPNQWKGPYTAGDVMFGQQGNDMHMNCNIAKILK